MTHPHQPAQEREIERLKAENAALRQTLHDELAELVRGLLAPHASFAEAAKLHDEAKKTLAAYDAALAAGGGEAVAWVDAKAVEWIASPDRSPQASILTNLYRSKIGDDLVRLCTHPAPPAPAIPQWQPIETAPKDGSLFLCWVDAVQYGESDEGQQYQIDVSQVDFCQWQSHEDAPDGGWFEPCCGQISDHQRITHWMPLPASPLAAAQKEASNG